MKKQNKVKLLKNAIMLVPVTAGLLLTLNGGRTLVTTPRVDSISTSLTASSVDMSSFHANASRQADELYARLKSGEITGSEFSSEYSKITGEHAIEEWARNSEDEQVKGIVQKYDMSCENVDKAAKDTLKYFYSGVATLGLSAVASVGVENYLKKKYGLDSEADMDSMGESETSAMDIEA